MARDFQIAGPTLVSVRGGMHWASGYLRILSQLGLCQEAIKIEVKNFHRNIGADSTGPGVTVDVMVNSTECEVSMRLIHFDPLVLSCCISDSMGGATLIDPNLANPPGFNNVRDSDLFLGRKPPPGGRLLGNGLPRFASGNYYVGLNLQRADDMNERPWRFFYAYLMQQPIQHKIGVEASVVELKWRAIRYIPLWQSPAPQDFSEANANTNNAPAWVEQLKSIQKPNDTFDTYRMLKEIRTDSYDLPLWDHTTDDDSNPF